MPAKTTINLCAAYRAIWREGYMDEDTMEEITAAIHASGIKAKPDEIRTALLRLADSYPPTSKGPGAPHIIAHLRKLAHGTFGGPQGGGAEGLTETGFMRALRIEADPERRWSMICHAGDAWIYSSFGDDQTVRIRNHAYIHAPAGMDARRMAQDIADRNGIEYVRYVPDDDSLAIYFRKPDRRAHTHGGVRAMAEAMPF
jgi:hypothetical protein